MFLFLSLASNMQDLKIMTKGLGQLEAYIDAEEGVAFEMDNGRIWESMDDKDLWGVMGMTDKTASSKFLITTVPTNKVMLRNWKGVTLAPKSTDIDPDTYPLLLVPYSEDPSLQFEVFYRKNKVAFLASNGLFLARVYRSFHTIEAAKAVADDTCFFRPLVGDINPPKFEIIDMVAIGNVPLLKSSSVMTKTFTNTYDAPRIHTFIFTWGNTVTDKITWERLWGLGIYSSHRFKIHTMTANVKYKRSNEKEVFVRRRIYERRRVEVVVPPKYTSTVELHAHKSDRITVPFMATIRKSKPNGNVIILSEKCKWTGFLYYGLRLRVKIEPSRP